MNPYNVSPQQFEQMKNMMNPEMFKSASNMLNSMSDDQLRQYLNSMGMGSMDPQMFRNMSQSLGNMNSDQINNLKNSAPYSSYNNYNNMYNNSANANTSSSQKSSPYIDSLNKIKSEGNDLFRNKKYNEACEIYYKLIEQIENAEEDKQKEFKNELNDIERIARLNIAACKLNLNDYDTVIKECSTVLENNKCFKAYFRMGLAYLNKKEYQKAYKYLDNANALGNANEKKDIEKYITQCKEELEKIKQKRREERLKKEEEENKKKEAENAIKEQKSTNENKNQNQNDKSDNTNGDIPQNEDKKTEILEEKKDSSQNNDNKEINKEILKEDNKAKKDTKPETKIDDIETDDIKIDNDTSKDTINTSSNANIPPNNFQQPYYGMPQMNQQNMQDAMNQFQNMSDDQLNYLGQTFQSMDNETIKNIMRSQGMNLSDEDVARMKNQINPSTLRMVKNMGGFKNPNPSMNANSNSNQTNNSQSSNTESTGSQNNNANNQFPQMPDMSKMDYQSMLNYLKQNPQLLNMISPQLSKMFGGKDIDPNLMINAVDKIMWIFSIPSRIKRFFTSKRGIIITILVIGLIIAYFKR